MNIKFNKMCQKPSNIHATWLTYLICWTMLIQSLHTASNAPTCNCISVKDCEPFTTLLLNHNPDEREAIYRLVRNAGCGFDRLEPLACCPTKAAEKQTRARSRGIDNEARVLLERSSRTPTTSSSQRQIERWIWDRKPYQAQERSSVNPVTSRFSNSNFDANVLDFKDPKTQRNCPHAFYEEEGDENDEFNDESHNVDDEDDIEDHNHHHHYKYHIHHHNFEDDTLPLIYPDDKRLNRPITFPQPPKRHSNTKPNKPNTNATATNPTGQTTSVASLINSLQCGISIGTRIFGGVESVPGQFPWISRIAYVNTTSNRISYRCSGAVISFRHVVTAAHCVVNLVSDLKLSHVRIGDAGISIDCGRNPSSCRIYEISGLIVHPNYDQPKYSNDIALLTIIRTQNTEVNYATICLPLNNSTSLANDLIGSTGVVAGWSTNTEGTETANATVKYLRLPIVNATACAITYSQYSENFNDPIVISPHQLCAQGQPMNDVCRGDSGGPFMDDGTSGLINSNGRYTLLGIVAFGPTTCGLSNFPGVYTRVSSYVQWIVENIS